jgi:hypothetical protein
MAKKEKLNAEIIDGTHEPFRPSNYALMNSEAVVVKVFESPTPEFVEEYNANNVPRIYACPPETKVGWVRVQGVFGPAVKKE